MEVLSVLGRRLKRANFIARQHYRQLYGESPFKQASYGVYPLKTWQFRRMYHQPTKRLSATPIFENERERQKLLGIFRKTCILPKESGDNTREMSPSRAELRDMADMRNQLEEFWTCDEDLQVI